MGSGCTRAWYREITDFWFLVVESPFVDFLRSSLAEAFADLVTVFYIYLELKDETDVDLNLLHRCL